MSEYEINAQNIANKLDVTLVIKGSEFKPMWGEKQIRTVFKCQLKRGKKSFTFDFGQSIMSGTKQPTLYDVLTCMTKNEPEDFEFFCSGFGYDQCEEESERVYKAVCKEYENMCKLFSMDELEMLQEIQ